MQLTPIKTIIMLAVVFTTMIITQHYYIYVTGPARIDHVNASYTELYFG